MEQQFTTDTRRQAAARITQLPPARGRMSQVWSAMAIRRFLTLAACLLLLVVGIPATASAATPQSVEAVSVAARVGGPVPAVSVRPGPGWGQIEILFDSVETERVARSLWGGAVVCWPAAALGVAGYSSCIAMATVCAARAYLSRPRARAAVTMTVWGYGWCWKY